MNVPNILYKIKVFYKLDKDQELANKLEISRGTLASWKSRNSLDLTIILEKCPELDLNWLLKDEKIDTNNIKEKEISYLKDELKKIDVEISEAERNISETGKGIRADAIKELDRLRAENAKLLEIIHNLSAKI